MTNMSLEIIIPAYNASSTLRRSLYSIATQEFIRNNKVNVYIINDCSEEDYKNEVIYFSKFYNIKELKLNKNMGPGYARQYGIDNSNDDYIVFLDADDYFCSPQSLTILYNSMFNSGADLVISKSIEECNQNYNVKNHNFTWLHGKVYSRQFLEKNEIRFNNSRANEDSGFNYLIDFHNPKVKYINNTTYIWSNNINSISRKNNREFTFYGMKGLAENIAWAGNLAIEKNLEKKEIFLIVTRALLTMWTTYSRFYDYKDSEKCYEWSKGLKTLYEDLKADYYTENFIQNEIEIKLNEVKSIDKNFSIVNSFEEFLNKI